MGFFFRFLKTFTLLLSEIGDFAVNKLGFEEKFPVAMDGNKIILTPDIFNDDALILSDFKSQNIKIKSNNHDRVISFSFDSPFLGIWAKPNAPYVCLEPWWGVNDNYDKKSDFSQKRGIMSLEPKAEKSFNWNVEICE